MVDNKSNIDTLLQGLQNIDPRLYDLLKFLTDDLNDLRTTVIPITVQRAIDVLTAPAPKTHAVDTFTCTILLNSLRFNWSTSDPNVKQYELRRSDGLPWETSSFVVRTTATQVDLNPIIYQIIPHVIYKLRTINADGVISDEEATIEISFQTFGRPHITPQVIDNNVLLVWGGVNTNFAIDYYNIYKNDIFIGTQHGTFFSTFEVFAGTFKYNVEAVDIAGNVGKQGSVTVEVAEPPDFVLQDSRVSDFSGIKTNVVLENTGSLLCCITTENWTNHFLSRGWGNINAQILAGYTTYGEPYALNGQYQEVIDYGAVFNNLIVNMDWSVNLISGSVSISPTIEASVDGTNWGTANLGKSAFFSQLRYIRITINFLSVDDKSLIEFYNLRIFLNTKLVLTSGSVSAKVADNTAATSSTHIGGTYVPFTKPYKSVNSITLTTNSQQPVTAIYDLIGIPNPDGFKVYVFDSAGIRIDQECSWKVRGTL